MTPQTFGNTAVESPDIAQTVPEEDSSGSRVTPAAEESAVTQSVMAAILCDQYGLTYDPEDPCISGVPWAILSACGRWIQA